MPVGKKKIYDFMSPKIADKRKNARKMARGRGPEVPPVVNNYEVNAPKFAQSRNTSPTLQTKRLISPNEGKVAVNSRADDKLQKKAVTKTRPKIKEVDSTAGVINVPKTTKKKTKKRTTMKRKTNSN